LTPETPSSPGAEAGSEGDGIKTSPRGSRASVTRAGSASQARPTNRCVTGSRRNSSISAELAARASSTSGERRSTRSPSAPCWGGARHERPNQTFCSAATTLLCGWYRPLCHCHQDRPTGSSRDQRIGLEQLRLPTIPFPLESPYTVPDRS
jgi:hypothetical protein